MAQPGEHRKVPNVVHTFDNSAWKHEGSADGEVICGVANECIIFPGHASNIVVPQPQAAEVVQYIFPDQDLLDIQVTEEEVISETWDNGQHAEDDRYVSSNISMFICSFQTKMEGGTERHLPKTDNWHRRVRR